MYNSGYGGTYTYGPTVSGCSATTQSVKPHAVLTANGSTHTYDCNGNLTSGGGRTIAWNYDNLPSSVTQGGATTTFAYNANGGRIQKTQGANTTQYFGLTEQVNGSWVQYYYAGPILVAKKQGTTKTWYHADRLGSIRLMTNASGVEVKDYDYQAFGAMQSQSGTMINERGFTGHITDAETGLIYMGARYYDASLTRFVSADTIVADLFNPQSLNRYSYVYNNPVNNTDPTGHRPCEDESCTGPSRRSGSSPANRSGHTTAKQEVARETQKAKDRPSGYQRLADKLKGDDWSDESSAETSSTSGQKTSRALPRPDDLDLLLDKAALVLDTLATGGTAFGTGIELGGCIFGPEGCGGGVAVYQITLNGPESILGWGSAAVTIFADWKRHNTIIDVEHMEITIGSDTALAVLSNVLGGLVSEAAIDTVINTNSVMNDMNNLTVDEAAAQGAYATPPNPVFKPDPIHIRPLDLLLGLQPR